MVTEREVDVFKVHLDVAIWDGLMEAEEERELTSRKELTVMSFSDRGRNRKRF